MGSSVSEGAVVLPRRLSLAVLWTLGGTLLAGGITAGVTHARIGHIEKAVQTYQDDHDAITTLRENARIQNELLRRIDDKVDRLLGR